MNSNLESQQKQLEDEILEQMKKISPDSYPVSIWEIVNMYTSKDIDIKPDFQRVFRWDKIQKSRLIESIFLWLPLPSFFVSTNEKRQREIIDGLQRISTILEFMWVLAEDNKSKINSKNSISEWLVIKEEFKYLKKLWWIKWANLSEELQREFKRYKLNFNILKIASDKEAKYELFQRLNTWWTQLSNQEIRNCLMIMENKVFFEYIEDLAKIECFKNCVSSLSDEDINTQYDKELILRFFCVRNNKINNIYSVEEFITKNMFLFLKEFDYENEKNIFTKTFQLLNDTLWEDVFKRHYSDWGFKRKMILPIYDIVTLRVSNNINQLNADILNKIILWIRQDSDITKKIKVWPSIESKLKFALWNAQSLLDKKLAWVLSIK